jgi:Tfp pilus assembly protein PilF
MKMIDKKRQDTDTTNDTLSVKGLEAKLKSRPNDIELKKSLANALVDRYIYGEEEKKPGNQTDIKRAREIVKDLPEDRVLYLLARLARLSGKEKESTEWLVKFVSAFSQENDIPFDSGELYTIISDFDFSPKLWLRLANVLSQSWPDSAAVFTLRGIAKSNDVETSGEAVDYFVRALNKDESYWLAAWWCALVYYQGSNWRAARNYFYKALSSEVAWKIPDIHFDLAWCLGKIRDYQEEEKHYRSCVELNPDYPHARNNLGWSLYQQGKYAEALEIFEEAIKRGNDGKYPLRNKARALIKLDRLLEAKETLEQDIYRGKLTKFANEEIARIQERIAKQEQGEEEIEEEEIEEQEVIAGDNKERQRIKRRTPVPSEQWLERMLEEKIQKYNEAFNRRLRMYDRPEGYGRQFAIPKVGQIDLLVEDIEENDLIVIELKQGTSDDQVIGQISRYITWVRENLAQRDQKVLGIVCVYHASSKLQLSARNIPGLEVFEYGLTLQRII